MTSQENIRAQERGFYHTVMLGVDAMLPGSSSRIYLHRVDAPDLVNELRKNSFSTLDTGAPIDYLQLRYNSRLETFCIHTMSLQANQGRKVRLNRKSEGYDVAITSGNIASPKPRLDFLSNHDVALAFGELGMSLHPPTDDPLEYQHWLHSVTEKAQAWGTRDESLIRRAKAGSITARLVTKREADRFPDGNLVERGGVEYRITDSTPPLSSAQEPVNITNVAYVGETRSLTEIDFSSYMHEERYYPTTRQRDPRTKRHEVLLTPKNQSVWLRRLVDENTGAPYAAPTLE